MYTRYYDPEIFINCFEGIDRTNHIVATYFMEDELPGEDFIDHFSLIQSMAVEGSTGTWQKVAEETDEVRRMLSGKMVGYFRNSHQQAQHAARRWCNWPSPSTPGLTTSP